MVKKNYDKVLSRFHLIPERHGQTDRWTDGQTDRIGISVSRVGVLTRDKNTCYVFGLLYLLYSFYIEVIYFL